jgi:hypothetical protein
MRGGDKADAAEAAAAGLDHRLQHLFDRRTQPQIGVTDNAGVGAGVAIWPSRREGLELAGPYSDRLHNFR